MRRTRLRTINPERRARLYEEQFGDHGNRVRALPCAVCWALPPSEPAHVKSRGAGGKWQDIVPLCQRCHREQHQRGLRTFQRERQVDLQALAALLAETADGRPMNIGLVNRLAQRDLPLRGHLLRECPARVPKTVAFRTAAQVGTWAAANAASYEISRTLDLYETLLGWRSR